MLLPRGLLIRHLLKWFFILYSMKKKSLYDKVERLHKIIISKDKKILTLKILKLDIKIAFEILRNSKLS